MTDDAPLNPWYSVSVPGEPETWGLGVTPGAGKKALKAWQEMAAWSWRQQHRSRQVTGPVELTMRFAIGRSSKDWTNLAKGLEDALKHIAFGDDVMVYKATVVKEPAAKGAAFAVIGVRRWHGPVFQQHLGSGPARPRTRQPRRDVRKARGLLPSGAALVGGS